MNSEEFQYECSKCHAVINADDKVCIHCGEKFDDDSPSLAQNINTSVPKPKHNTPIFIVLGVFVIIAIVLNIFSHNPEFTDLRLKAKHFLRTNNSEEAEQCYWKLTQIEPDNIDNHYDYVITHYIYTSKDTTKNSKNLWNTQEIKKYYQKKTTSSSALQRDIGYYLLGLCEVEEKNYSAALPFYDSIINRNQKYLNNSIGYVYLQNKDTLQAEKYFRKENR
jgi:tetratricopeptide (TPR) repeat protein